MVSLFGNSKRIAVSLCVASSTVAFVGLSGTANASVLDAGPTSVNVAGITILWPTLDPATDSQSGSDIDLMNSIYGELFESGKGGKIVPDIASGYKITDGGRLVTITLRPGVKFSDGTPLNAAAAVSSMTRALQPSALSAPSLQALDITSATKVSNLKFSLHLSQPLAAIMTGIQGTAANWVVDPTALQKMGTTAYGQKPVGAGPFTVKSNTASSSISLVKNPNYWEKGHPFLQSITYSSVGTAPSAYLSLQSGSTNVITGPLDPSTSTSARSAKELMTTPGVTTIGEQLNTTIPPFNNADIRQAAYYATDSKSLVKSVGLNLGTVSQSFGGPGTLFWEKTVPGYRSYNPAKAKQLVAASGLKPSVTITTTGNPAEVWAEAIANEWTAVGINAKVLLISRQQLVANYSNHNWTSAIQLFGSGDPSLGIGGTQQRLASTGQFSGIKDPKLDKLLIEASTISNPEKRQKLYSQAWSYLNQKAYLPFVGSIPLTIVVSSADKAAIQPAVTEQNGLLVTEWENVK